MEIKDDFLGGNIQIEKHDGNTYYLNNELRDTQEDWFYWAFCAEGFGGETVTFKFPENRIGYYGPAVSRDLKKWEWLGKGEEVNSFTYTFAKDENKVYFAHSMLYHPDRFYEFCKEKNVKVRELCKSGKGRSVPYITFGNGDRMILLTSRHHACESSGDYVLEGVLEGLLENPVKNTKVVCVPFVDFDGVVNGDQGKSRAPYDHNRDYDLENPAIYPETAAIRKIAKNGILFGFDFHSPWHCFNENDRVFIVRNRKSKLDEFSRFGMCLENNMNENALQYRSKNDYPPETNWNSSRTPCFANYMLTKANADIAFTLETAYFGTEDNIFSQDNAVELGRCFARSIKDYDEKYKKISFTGDIMCSQKMVALNADDYSCLFEEIEDELKEADYLVGNLETPIAGKELLYTHERYCFNTPEIYLDALKKCGIDLLTLANNHALDRDEEGIAKTLDNCRSRGFDTIGIYKTQDERDSVFVKEIGGIRVAFLNYTYGVNSFANHMFLKHKYMVNLYQPEETLEGSIHLLNSNDQIKEDVDRLYHTKNDTFDNILKPYLNRLKRDIEKARKEADYVVMCSHCGGQYNSEVDAYTLYVCEQVKKFGADIIINNHPHIIQNSSVEDGYFISYSIGNFLSDNGNGPENQERIIDANYSALVNLYIKEESGKIKTKIGFKILKNIAEDGRLPKTVNTYNEYIKEKNEKYKNEILFYANRFANADCYDKVQKEYVIEL